MPAHWQSMTKLIEMGEVVYVMMVCGEMAMIERCNGFTTVTRNAKPMSCGKQHV